MGESWDTSNELTSQSDESNHFDKPHIEPIYDAFKCPLTKQVMRDPVTLENGLTFEREAIEKWFRECRESGRKIVCPVTQIELRNMELNSSIALRNAIKQWHARNEAAQLDTARRSLTPSSSEQDVLQALRFIQHLCQKSQSHKTSIRNEELIPMIIDMLKSSCRRVRLKALETLRVVVEEDSDNKDIVAQGDTVRTIVKFLSYEAKEREEAVSLLYELSKSEALCERIGAVKGAILLLVGMASSKSENLLIVDMADRTLENLEKCENNVRQMAETGRLQPLLKLVLEGSSEAKLSMASFLGDLVLNNDVKVLVANTVGLSLINIMKSGSGQSREAALKALNQISSYEVSAKILIEAGIIPPLVKDLFTVGAHQLPTRLKEVSATILANVVNSGYDFDVVPVGPKHQTLVSEDIIHNLLYLISNTGPAIECNLLYVLVGLTNSPITVTSVVSAIKSSGATVSLVQFIEATQRDLRVASIKLLQNLSPHMGPELASCLGGTSGQLGSLIKIISENITITEEQAAAIGLLANLPERDTTGLTKQMLDEGAFRLIIPRIVQLRQGGTRGSRFVTPYLEGLVKVLARISFVLGNEPDAITLCRDYNIAALFIDLLQANGLDNVQMFSALALENLSRESKNLTESQVLPNPGFCGSIFPCLSKSPVITELCRVHRGNCSLKETFCLLEGQAVEKLVALLDHINEKVIEASLAALCTLLEDGVHLEQGVEVLCEAEGIRPILDVLLEKRTENLITRAVWAVERILRSEDLANEISSDSNVSTALVDAYQHADYKTRQIAERALRLIDRIPNFSGIFPSS